MIIVHYSTEINEIAYHHKKIMVEYAKEIFFLVNKEKYKKNIRKWSVFEGLIGISFPWTQMSSSKFMIHFFR